MSQIIIVALFDPRLDREEVAQSIFKHLESQNIDATCDVEDDE